MTDGPDNEVMDAMRKLWQRDRDALHALFDGPKPGEPVVEVDQPQVPWSPDAYTRTLRRER